MFVTCKNHQKFNICENWLIWQNIERIIFLYGPVWDICGNKNILKANFINIKMNKRSPDVFRFSQTYFCVRAQKQCIHLVILTFIICGSAFVYLIFVLSSFTKHVIPYFRQISILWKFWDMWKYGNLWIFCKNMEILWKNGNLWKFGKHMKICEILIVKILKILKILINR